MLFLTSQTFPPRCRLTELKSDALFPPIFKIVLLACVFYFCWWQPPCTSPTQAVIQASCLGVSPSPHLPWLWHSVTRSFWHCPCKSFLIFFPFYPDLSAHALNPGQVSHPVTCSFACSCKVSIRCIQILLSRNFSLACQEPSQNTDKMTVLYSRPSSHYLFYWTVANPAAHPFKAFSIGVSIYIFNFVVHDSPSSHRDRQAQSHHPKTQKVQQIFTQSRTVIISGLISDEIIRK